MRPQFIVLTALLSTCDSALAQETIKSSESKPPSQHQHHGQQQTYSSSIQSPTHIRYYLPDLSNKPLSLDQPISLPKVGFEGYYALVVEKQSNEIVSSEIRYFYKNGRPLRNTHPKALLSLDKTPLEIEPNPFPPEHNLYYGGKSWNFLVRFQGKPLNQIPVVFSSSNNTNFKVITNQNGIVKINLPDDFTNVKSGLRANKPAQFTLSASVEKEGRRYETRLVNDYHVSSSHWQSFNYGLVVLGSGLLFGGLINTRLNSKPLKVKKTRSR